MQAYWLVAGTNPTLQLCTQSAQRVIVVCCSSALDCPVAGAWAELELDTRSKTYKGDALVWLSHLKRRACDGLQEAVLMRQCTLQSCRVSSTVPSSACLLVACSYQGMGTALVECKKGCKCQATKLDGAWDQRMSLFWMLKLYVSQHERCRLRVTVSGKPDDPDEQAGGHKVTLVRLGL